MIWGRILPCQVSVSSCNPVPQKAKNEPAEGKGSNEQEEDKSPPDLNERGPEVGQEGKVPGIMDVSIFDVTATIFGH